MEAERIQRLLPEIYQTTLAATPNVLGAFLNVMERLHNQDEAVLAHLEAYFDPNQTLDAWLPFLASWVDLDRFLNSSAQFPGGPARLRALILAAVRLSQERGTRGGLCAFLETATGLSGFDIDEAPDRPYHIIVSSPPPDETLPEMSQPQYRAWLSDLIRSEKPAYVTFELRIQPPKKRAARESASGKGG